MYENFDPYNGYRASEMLPDNPTGREIATTKSIIQKQIEDMVPYDFSDFLIYEENQDPKTMRLVVSVTYLPPHRHEIDGILYKARKRAQSESRKYYPRYPDPFPSMYRYSEMWSKRFEKDFKNSSTIKFRRYGNFEPEKS